MIDTHSHILYGIDDGSRNIEESINIIKSYNEIGIKNIILTPHYIKDTSYMSPRQNNLKILENLKKSLKENNINTNLYLGNEIYIDKDITKLLEQNEINSLNNTKYLLIELPMSGKKEGYYDIFLDLINKGYKVVLAHPERYKSFQQDFEKVYELEDIGVLFQCNIGSIVGEYGTSAKKVMKRMLKENLVYMLGTDVHRYKDYDFIIKANKKIKKYTKKEQYIKIIKENAKELLK